uniref:Uncharacterized protein n=1 Tax=Panagrolaimus sp. PS1159 TaxID=55785 RepID=A0AC35GDC3_9BILA
MASVFIECYGIFYYRSPDTAAKMSVVLSVVQKKISLFKDQQHKILLENAYFFVIPPEESQTTVPTRDSLHSYISLLIRLMSSNRKGRDPVKVLAGIDWTDIELVNFICTELSDVCTVRYDNVADIADNVRCLSDDFPYVGIFIIDNVLYQLITLGIYLESYSLDQLLLKKQIAASQKFNGNDPAALDSIKEEDAGGIGDEEVDDEDKEYDEEDGENDDRGSSQTSEVPTQYVDADDPENVHVRKK